MSKEQIYNVKKQNSGDISSNTQGININIQQNRKEIIKPQNDYSYSLKIKNFIKKAKIPLIIIGILIIISIIVAIVVIASKKNDNRKNPNLDDNIFRPLFKINSKEDTLTQLFCKSFQSYESTINKEKLPYIIFNKAIYDIYTLNSTSSPKEDKYFYTTKYATVITVNSLCTKLESDDCKLEKILDLNKREEANFRRNDTENVEELIQNAILPICIVEHTDTNLIVSITCPETLSSSFKNDIIQAFQSIKENSTKGIISEDILIDVSNEERENKVYINIYNNNSFDLNKNSNELITYNFSKNIITDKYGNLISSKKIMLKNIIYDKNNKFSENFTYDFQNIPLLNSTNFNSEIYKSNLNIVFTFIQPIMKKEIFINNFTEYFINLNQKEKNKRELSKKEAIENQGIQEENIFNKTIFDIPISLNIKNDLGLRENQFARAISNYDTNNENNVELSFEWMNINIKNIMNEFISVSKGGNILANKLKKELNEPLLNLRNIIKQNIEAINNLLAEKDLSEIFDSTLALKKINSLSSDFIPTIGNLSNSLDDLYENISFIMNNTLILLNQDISDFLNYSHNLIFRLFDNLTEITDILSSKENKIIQLSNYYLDNKNTSYYLFIKEIINILDNYNKRERETIIPLTNKIISNFYEKNIAFAQKINSKLNYISEKLKNRVLLLNYSSKEEFNQTLIYIQNSQSKINEILRIIKNKFNETININENNNNFHNIKAKAINISKTLDNNDLIDTAFDKVITNFREQFLFLLKNMENSLKEKFPLEENVLSCSFFDNIFIKQIDDYFNTEKSNIINYIKNENYDYLSAMDQIFNSFLSNNEKLINQKITDILNDFSDLILDNLNKTYSETLSLTFVRIDQILGKNVNLGNDYLTAVQNANSYHITSGYINKYNIYINSIETINAFINNYLKSYLENRYYNVINQIKQLFQSIIDVNNNILQKYYNQLSFSESHFLMIQKLVNRLNNHISVENFNQKFLPLINNFIQVSKDFIQNIKLHFQNLYNVQAQKSINEISNDYDIQNVHQGSRYCCKTILRHCRKHCYYPDTYSYSGANVAQTNNHLLLESINFNDYVQTFDATYNGLYTKLSNHIKIYNSYIPNLISTIESKKNEIIGKTPKYLNNLEQKIKSIIDQKLGKNLLNESYSYYKNEILNLLPEELNNILNEWKIVYDAFYENITLNREKLKYSINEFYIIASSYFQIYLKNISYEYIDTIVEKLKNEFNYANKYYYNIINSKINKAYNYILNNIPINEKPLDEILTIRISEIKKSFNEMINNIKNSQNNYLSTTPSNDDFFPINDIRLQHIRNFSLELNETLERIKLISNEIKGNYDDEFITSKFYLEKIINEKQIKDIYDVINKANFIDLQNNVYYNLIKNIWKNDKDGMNKNLISTLKYINENNINEYNIEKEKYIKILNDKLNKEFKTTKNIEERINSIFSNGLIDVNENIKSEINDVINSVLNKIKQHITNEVNRLSNELTSYSNNFNYIQNRLNNYKNTIYEKVYLSITYVITNFHEQIIEKFYKNYLIKGLNDFGTYFNNTKNETTLFLNMSINLYNDMNKNIETLKNEYKNVAWEQIEFLFQKNMQKLDIIFSFNTIKSTIFNEINNLYNVQLLPILQREATYIYEGEGISYYDLPPSIINDIDNYIEEQSNKIKQIMKRIEGNQYIINDFIEANFINEKNNITDNIKSQFNNFSIVLIQKEKELFNIKIDNMISDNFVNIINEFIPTFGVDFFDRILKFNDIQKINRLYDQLKYSFNQTITYYLELSNLNKPLILPINLKNEIISLNNFELLMDSKNNQILSYMNAKLNQSFQETKDYIVKRYINDIKSIDIFNSQFNPKIMEVINILLNSNINQYENIYMNLVEKYIKNSFINGYKNILNYSSKDMKYFIHNLKLLMEKELNNLFILDSEGIKNNILVKVSETNLVIDEYNKHLTAFKVSDEVINFFDKLSSDIILSKYNRLNDLLNKESFEFIKNNSETLSNEFKDEYSIDKFTDFINKKNINFSLYFDNYIKILNSYGSTKDNYTENLNKEIIKYNNLKSSEETNDRINWDNSFKELKTTATLIQEYINNLDLFEAFEEKIKNHIKDKNIQYEYSKYILNNNKDENTNYDLLIQRLENLKNISSQYYYEANIIYHEMKNHLIDNINRVNEKIHSCENITKEIINNNYKEIKEKFKTINITKEILKEDITILKYNFYEIDKYFTVETEIENYYVYNEFFVDIDFEDSKNNPKVIGKIVNNIKPKIFNIDFYSSSGQMVKIGRKINVNFNNIMSYTKIIFDGKLNNANIVTNFNFDEYSVETQYYEEKTTTYEIVICGISFCFPDVKNNINLETPANEKHYEVPSKNKTIIEKYEY